MSHSAASWPCPTSSDHVPRLEAVEKGTVSSGEGEARQGSRSALENVSLPLPHQHPNRCVGLDHFFWRISWCRARSEDLRAAQWYGTKCRFSFAWLPCTSENCKRFVPKLQQSSALRWALKQTASFNKDTLALPRC